MFGYLDPHRGSVSNPFVRLLAVWVSSTLSSGLGLEDVGLYQSQDFMAMTTKTRTFRQLARELPTTPQSISIPLIVYGYPEARM